MAQFVAVVNAAELIVSVAAVTQFELVMVVVP